jgi:hypothetical protein
MKEKRMDNKQVSESIEKMLGSLGIGTFLDRELWDVRLSKLGQDVLSSLDNANNGQFRDLSPLFMDLLIFLLESMAIGNQRQNEISSGIFRRLRGIAETLEILSERINRIESALELHD